MSDETYEVADTAPLEPGPPVGPEAPAAPDAPAAAPSTPTYAAAPVYAAPSPPEHVSFPKRWLVIGGGIALAFVLLSGTFAAGVAVGHRAGAFDRDGISTMQGQQPGGTRGGQPGGPMGGYGQGRGDGPGWHGDQQTQPDDDSTTQSQ